MPRMPKITSARLLAWALLLLNLALLVGCRGGAGNVFDVY